MMIEFCCKHCGRVKVEPSELHEDPRNPQCCTACAVKLCKPLAPPKPPDMREPFNHRRGEEFAILGFATLCVALGFLFGWVARGGA